MDDQAISPLDIYKAMNTDDRNTYDREVTGLRKAKILVEIRKNSEASAYAKRKKISKQKGPRFRVQIPQKSWK